MGDMEPEEIKALVDEFHALQVENQRLRSLLGLDEPSRHEVTEPWNPLCSSTRTRRT
jgi:regulator of replication initiation timing